MKKVQKTPSHNLEGRLALVTGGSRGLGYASACALALAGAEVTIVGRNSDSGESAVEAIKEEGGRVKFIALDVSDIKSVREFSKYSEEYEILVNNAGTNKPLTIEDVDEETYDNLMNLNVKGAYFMTQGVVRKLLKSGSKGSIINISSRYGLVGAVKRTVYCVSKFGLEGLTKSLALELASSGIRVNSICPSFMETDLTRPFLEDASYKRQILTNMNMGRIGNAEDIMGAILYFAGDMSSFVTGTSLPIDGGWSGS